MKKNEKMNITESLTPILWISGWLFSWGYLKLGWLKGLLVSELTRPSPEQFGAVGRRSEEISRRCRKR
jgi:hypothetical protein